MTPTEPKELARQARLLLHAASAITTLLNEVQAEELRGYRYHATEAVDDMIKAAVTCPGLRVAVFANGEGEAK